MINLCQYSTLLGRPRQGLHRARIPVLDLALWDVVGTFALAYLTFYFFPNWSSNYLVHLAGWFLLATLLHLIFCVPTKITSLFT